VLGFEKCRLSGGPSGFFWDVRLVERLKARYYPILLKSTSLTSLTSQLTLITKDPEQKKLSASEVGEENEVSEASLEGLAPNVKELTRLMMDFQDKYVVCGFSGHMDFQVNEYDGSWVLLWGKCGFELQKKLGKV
jgi:hypothetical protein